MRDRKLSQTAGLCVRLSQQTRDELSRVDAAPTLLLFLLSFFPEIIRLRFVLHKTL
jgi:hypothetical protein